MACAGVWAVFIPGRSEPEGAIAIARRAVSHHEQVFVVLGRCVAANPGYEQRGNVGLRGSMSQPRPSIAPKCNVDEVGCLETFGADLDRMHSVGKAENVRKRALRALRCSSRRHPALAAGYGTGLAPPRSRPMSATHPSQEACSAQARPSDHPKLW